MLVAGRAGGRRVRKEEVVQALEQLLEQAEQLGGQQDKRRAGRQRNDLGGFQKQEVREQVSVSDVFASECVRCVR